MVAPTEYVEILHHAIGSGLSGAQNRRFWCQNAAAVRFWTEKPPAAVRCARKSPRTHFAYRMFFCYTHSDTQISVTEVAFMDDAGPADGNLCAHALFLRYDLYKAKLRHARQSDLRN